MLWAGLGLQLELPLGDGESGRERWEGGIQKERKRGREGREGRRSACGSFNCDLIREKLVREWHWPPNFLHSVQKCNMK